MVSEELSPAEAAVAAAYARIQAACPRLQLIDAKADDAGELNIFSDPDAPAAGQISGWVDPNQEGPSAPTFDINLTGLSEAQAVAVAAALAPRPPVPSGERWALPHTVTELRRLLASPPITLVALNGGGVEDPGPMIQLDRVAFIERGDLDVLVRHFSDNPPPPPPAKPTVVVEISGGVCQEGYSDVPVDVVLIDWDDIQAGGKAGTILVHPLAAMGAARRAAFDARDT